MMSRFLILLALSVIVLVLFTEYPHGNSLSIAAAESTDLWASYQGAMVQTIQTRYCQQFLSNYVNFRSVGVSTYTNVKIPVLEDVTNLAGNQGAEIMRNLKAPPVAPGSNPFGRLIFGNLFPGPHHYPDLAAVYNRLNEVHAEWNEMMRWVRENHPSGHLGFAPTTSAPGIPLSALYSITRNHISDDQRYTRARSWLINNSASTYLSHPNAGKCDRGQNPLCEIFARLRGTKANVCAPSATPEIYFDEEYINENVEFWTTASSEIEDHRKNNCNTGASHIGYVLSSQLPNTLPLYRISYKNNLFIYTTHMGAPHHFQSRGSGYSVSILGYLYREWPCAVSMGTASVTQVVTEPVMALWTANNMCPLYHVLSHSPIRSSVAYIPASMGQDGLYSERYKNMLVHLPSIKPDTKAAAANAFSRMQQGVVKCDGSSLHPWKIVGTSLSEFMASASSGTNRVSIAINRDSTTTIIGESQVAKAQQHHFFGFYTLIHPTQQPIHVQRDRFSMLFEAQGFMGIKVSPGDWMDRAFVRAHANELRTLGFFGENGKLPLTPRIIWVAYKPSVTITLKTTEIQKLVTTFSNPNTAAISIGGIRFTSHSVNGALDANGVENTQGADTVTLSEPREVEWDEEEHELEAMLESILESEDETASYDEEENEAMSSIIGMFLRLNQLKRDQVVVEQQRDTIQTAKFQSNSNDAVIVGITSENTESIGSAFNW